MFSGKKTLSASVNEYDRLGNGIYFWEHNARRAHDFAREVRDQPRHRGQKVKQPAVVGAVIDLGHCLNLQDAASIDMVRDSHRDLLAFLNESNAPIPANSGGNDRLLRRLDCAVIEFLHEARKNQDKEPFDSVRALFLEGEAVYEHAGFFAKSHIQLCVRNTACIKGYFRPLGSDGRPLSLA